MNFKKGMLVRIKGTSFTARTCGLVTPMEDMVGKTYVIQYMINKDGAKIETWSWDCRDLEHVSAIEKFSKEDKTAWKSLFE